MIPIKLTIQGLYSYQEKQTIDFTKLTAANLFGIFGSVGSGKSSILEAITFSLYGRTDRLNLSGDNRNYNMMNLKSNELLIDFTFETGKDQTAYRATVKGRRNSKKFDEVKTLERAAYRNDGAEWIPVEPESLEKAIGLSYENFKRTIIIPQGQFQEFLQLGNKDRTQMMKELFNLEKFELYYKVASLDAKNNAHKQNLEGQLQQLGIVDSELVKQFEDMVAALKIEIEQLSKSITENQKQEIQWKQLQVLVTKLEEMQCQFNMLKEKEPEFATLETTIRQYEQCLIHFKSQLDALEASRLKIVRTKEQIELETAQIKKVEVEIARSETQFAAIKTAYDQREQLKQQADELDRVLRIQQLRQQIETDKDRLKKGSEILLQTIEKAEKWVAEKLKLEQFIRAEKAKLPDLSLLSKVKTWHVDRRNLVQQLNEQKTDIATSKQKIDAFNQSFKSQLQTSVLDGFSEQTDIPSALLFLKEKVVDLNKRQAKEDSEANHLRVQSKLEAYANELHDGEACPLCGSLNHPQVFSAESVTDTLAKLSKSKIAIEKEVLIIGETTDQLSELNTKLNISTDDLTKQQGKAKLLQEKIDAHQTIFIWPEYQQEEFVSAAFKMAEQIQKELKTHETNLENSDKQIAQNQIDKDRFQLGIDTLKTALTVSETEMKTLSEQLRFIVLEAYLAKNAKEIETEKHQLLQKFVQLEKQFSELSDRLTELRKKKDTLAGSLGTNGTELKKESELVAIFQLQLAEKLSQFGYSTAEEVKQILAKSIDLELEKQVLENFKQQIALAQNQMEQLKLEIGDRVYNPELHQKLLAEIGVLSEALSQKNQDLGKIEEQLKKLHNDLQNQALLQKELANLELRADNIKTMKSLFKGSGFVNYISSVYLQNLCNAANDRFFQLTRQKLSLEITGDNSFLIRDFMNGGKVRSVKTLSGGQTFQAALSLALALADNIQKITESNQNFFFLDEGFGSLDKESLSVVFDTLKSLRKENRIVGIISHVEEMQQEIDTHLRIVNYEDAGSIILQN